VPWEDRAPTAARGALAFDPVDGVYLFITDGDSGRRTWAYRWRRAAPAPSPEPGASATPTATVTPQPSRTPLVLPYLLCRRSA